MFPVRRELVGKRFAFIEGDGRTGRLRGSRTGLAQNWNDLNWVTGTILASNVEGLDAQNESVSSKKVKVCFISLLPHLFCGCYQSCLEIKCRRWRVSSPIFVHNLTLSTTLARIWSNI